MLSVRWETGRTRVSLHRMFLKAPKTVMQALGSYLNGKRKELDRPLKPISKNVGKGWTTRIR